MFGEIEIPTILLSALVGGVFALIPVWIRGKQTRRNEVLRLAVETAHRDFEFSQSAAKDRDEGTLPMSAYIAFHFEYLERLDKRETPKVALEATLSRMERLLPLYEKAQFTDYQTKRKVNKLIIED